ncbi:hypothetical protein EZY14_011190 [Kordia sp. TARA_039_SRF]|nr:hypothetical protein EZY14_011190 [Kordia sp. TARA_039_SRF]
MRSLRILCVGILFLNLACNDDNLDKVPNEYNQKELNISITSIEHLKNSRPKVEQNIRPLLDKINHRKKSSIELDFQIEESHVQIIEQENFTTYTFFVYRNTLTPGILENYTYKEYNDNTFEQYLLKYHYTFDQNGEIIYDTNIFEVDIIQGNSLISKSTVSCVPEFVEVLDSFICTYNERCTGSGRHEAGDNSCLCTPSPDTCDPANSTSCEYEYVWVYQGCNTGGGSIIDNNTGDNNTGGGSSTNDTDNMDNETQSLPLEDPRPIWESILNCINFGSLGQTDTTTIDPSILEQLYLTPRQWSQINEYLQNNSCSEDAQEFVIDVLTYMDNVEINENDYPGMEDGLPFNWWNNEELIEEVFQDPYETWKKLTEREKKLVKWYPIEAYKINKNRVIAFQKTAELYGSTPQNLNGKPDAFRHAFFHAINTKDINKHKTRLFADAHESEVPNRWILEKEMDLYNNYKGIDLIDSGNLYNESVDTIAILVYNMINNGDLVYLSPINYNDPQFYDNPNTTEPNDGNHGINTNTSLIPTNQ